MCIFVFGDAQPVPPPVSPNELAQQESAAVSLEPSNDVNLSPQPTSNVVSSTSGTFGQLTSDVEQPVSKASTDLNVTAEESSAAVETAAVASSQPSQLRSSKRSTQRATKSTHKSSSVSIGLCNEVILTMGVFSSFVTVTLF